MKQHYCFLERFNNYFNRKIIKHDSLLEYQNNSKSFFIPVDSQGAMLPFDFNPNDNVTTEIIANEVPFDPDYFLLLDDAQNIVQRWFVLEQKRNRQGQWLYTLRRDVVADNIESLINAPIFVHKGMLPETNPLILNSEGMNFNQIKVGETLLKDRSKSSWIVAYLSKNKAGTAITAQVPSDTIGSNYYTLDQIARDLGISEAQLIPFVNINGDRSNVLRFVNDIEIKFIYHDQEHTFTPFYLYTEHYNSDITERKSSDTILYGETSTYLFNTSYIADFSTRVIANRVALLAELTSIMNVDFYLEDAKLQSLQKYNGSYLQYNGKFYKIDIINQTDNKVVHRRNFSYKEFSSLETIAEETNPSRLNPNGEYFSFATSAYAVYLVINEVSSGDVVPTAEVNISSSRNVTADQEFDILAFPADKLILDNGGESGTVDSTITRRIVSELVRQEDANIYDVQLLPYSPLSYGFFTPSENSESTANLSSLTENKDFNFIREKIPASQHVSRQFFPRNARIVPPFTTPHRWQGSNDTSDYIGVSIPSTATISNLSITIIDPDNTGLIYSATVETVISDDNTYRIRFQFLSDVDNLQTIYDAGIELLIEFDYSITEGDPSLNKIVGAVFYIKNSSFSTTLDYTFSLSESMKIDSQCEMYRLLSPNYQGSFEFNVARNGGTVDFFTAYCTYKPYTPFIKVAPLFNFVYGSDYNDNRGLICSGDFSLPRVNDAWQRYQLENKNYQNIFNREIQNLELMQSLEARQQTITGGLGIVTDAVKGAVGGAIIGGGIGGAIAGGVISGGASAIGYGIDLDMMSTRHRENRSFAIDKFNYQLGNIKALPYTLTKVGAFDISSKIFPVLEHYSCSEEEKEALRQKIKYESMTVMTIGKFGDYYHPSEELHYFKGELIRNDDIADDTHVLDAIYGELLKGVYI